MCGWWIITVETMNIVPVCPGQASMSISLARVLLKRSKNVQQYVSICSNEIGISVEELLNYHPERLQETSLLQPIMTAFSLGVYKDFPYDIDYVLGLSLGEIAAWAIAGGISEKEAIHLSSKRGQFMQEAAEKRPGGMVMIRGNQEKCDEILDFGNRFGTVVYAGEHGAKEKIISGDLKSIESILQNYNVQRLPVSGAWHSPLMNMAKTKFQNCFSSLTLQNTRIPIVLNQTGTATRQNTLIQKNIISQLVSPMLWKQCLEFFPDNTLFVTIAFHQVTGKTIQRNSKQKVLNSTSLSAIRAWLGKSNEIS